MNAIATALFTTLTGGTALTSLLSGTAAVYQQQAPEGAVLPYVVFNKAGGGPDNEDAHDRRSLLYFVRGYAASGKTAGAVDAQVSALLHKQAVTVTGYRTLWCARETDMEWVETPPDGSLIFMAGAYYRIRIT